MLKTSFKTFVFLAAFTAGAYGAEPPSVMPPIVLASARANQPGASMPPANPEPVPRNGYVGQCQPVYDPVQSNDRGDWTCDRPSCFWVRGEYLLWWIKDSHYPALVTSGVPGGTPLPGVLGQPGTTLLFGGNDVDNEVRSGGRFSGGFWLNDCRTTGLEGSYFFLGGRSVSFDSASGLASGSTLIARPFFDAITGLPNAQLVAFPGLATGEIHVSASSRLQGADLNLLCVPCCKPCCDPCGNQGSCGADGCNTNCNSCRGPGYTFSTFAGVRYLQLDEDLSVTEVTRVNPLLPAGAPLFGGSTITMSDRFETHNYFYGGQVGAKGEICWGRMFVDFVGKVALGVTHEVVDIQGSTTISTPGAATVTTPAGFLATGSNSGHFTRDVFSVVPEVGINLGCQITQNLRASIGYTFLYWSSVVRPGDQVDLGLSGTQIPTDTRFNPAAAPARPSTLFAQTDFWAQGISFGMEFRY